MTSYAIKPEMPAIDTIRAINASYDETLSSRASERIEKIQDEGKRERERQKLESSNVKAINIVEELIEPSCRPEYLPDNLRASRSVLEVLEHITVMMRPRIPKAMIDLEQQYEKTYWRDAEHPDEHLRSFTSRVRYYLDTVDMGNSLTRHPSTFENGHVASAISCPSSNSSSPSTRNSRRTRQSKSRARRSSAQRSRPLRRF